MGPVAGDAVNPSMGLAAASMPRTLPQPDPPAFDGFPRSVGNALVRSVFHRKTDLTPISISDRCVDQGRHLPTAAGICRRWGGVGVQPHGCGCQAPRDGFTASRTPTPPRQPTESSSSSGSGFGRCIEQGASPADQPTYAAGKSPGKDRAGSPAPAPRTAGPAARAWDGSASSHLIEPAHVVPGHHLAELAMRRDVLHQRQERRLCPAPAPSPHGSLPAGRGSFLPS